MLAVPPELATSPYFYVMTVKTFMAADVDTVLLNTDEMAETWDYYPRGHAPDKTQVKVIPVPDRLDGTREVTGDGRVLHGEKGDKIRESQLLEMPAAVTITPTRGTGDEQDYFVNPAGEVWFAKRVIGIDADMQTVLCVRTIGLTTRRGQRRG